MKLPYYPITPVTIEAGFRKDKRTKSRRLAKLRLLGVTSWRLYPLKGPLALRPLSKRGPISSRRFHNRNASQTPSWKRNKLCPTPLDELALFSLCRLQSTSGVQGRASRSLSSQKSFPLLERMRLKHLATARRVTGMVKVFQSTSF